MKLYATRDDNVQCYMSLWIIALPITKGQVCCTDFTLDGCWTCAINALFEYWRVLSNFHFNLCGHFWSLSGCTFRYSPEVSCISKSRPSHINVYQKIPCMKDLRFWKRQVLVWWCFWVKILFIIHFDKNVMFLVEKMDKYFLQTLFI